MPARGLAWPVPVPPARLTDAFGSRESFTAGEFVTGAMHGGQDFAPPVPGQRGYPVNSVGAGRVVATRLGGRNANVWGGKPIYAASAGNFAIVEYVSQRPFLHAHGVDHTRIWVGYAHLEMVHVLVGTHVPAGARLGLMGATGAATGIHLHLDVFTDSPALGERAFGRRIDPMHVLEPKGPLMALTDAEQQRLLERTDALYDKLAKPNSRGWTFADIVKSHVIATLAEVRSIEPGELGSIDVDELTQKIVDEQAARLRE